MRSVITLGIGILIATSVPGVRSQSPAPAPEGAKSATAKPAAQAGQPAAKPAAPAAAKPAPQTGTPAKPGAAQAGAKPGGKPAAAKTAPQTAKPAAQAAAKPVPKAPVKAAAQKVEKPASGEARAAAESEIKQARRDPFESLVNRQKSSADEKLLPPGKAGLQVSTLRLDGIVKAPNGMIAVVSNPQARTYFLREGDHLYDGSVEKISMDGVSFHEEGKDAFGKPVERQVNKRLYSSPGEQQ
jgi:Tfp pilus assembly protein PilP